MLRSRAMCDRPRGVPNPTEADLATMRAAVILTKAVLALSERPR